MLVNPNSDMEESEVSASLRSAEAGAGRVEVKGCEKIAEKIFIAIDFGKSKNIEVLI